MTYQTDLPKAFPYKLRAPMATVRYMVREILDRNRTDVPQGSSFAVTVDNWDGTWTLWMSGSTKNFVVSKHPHVEGNIIHETDFVE